MKNLVDRSSIIVIGAGAAGLACAAQLKKNGLSPLILEARERIGGRILTRRHSPAAHPIELGAEFIHGTPSVTLKRFEQLSRPFVDVVDDHLFRRGNSLKPQPDFFELMSDVMQKLRTPNSGSRERTIREFLREIKITPRKRDLFAAFVEGFHAADLDRMGEFGLASTEETEESDLNGIESFRIPSGYDSFVNSLAQESAADIVYNQQVVEVRWKRGHVTVQTQHAQTGAAQEFHAAACVITVPIGVLKSQTITWSPEPPGLQKALNGIEMGHVLRLAFEFKSRFWESLSEKPVSYLHADSKHRFPTWWSFSPIRTPHLVAWQGGPKAHEMSAWSHSKLIESAIETLSYITGKKQEFLKREIVRVDFHNWSLDPFSLGAYSFVAHGGVNVWKRITRPFADTLYFAGEGTALGSERGTVHGALHSGERCANQILRKRGVQI